MKVISRQRNKGKTTILLHYMVCEPLGIYVASTEGYAKRAFEKAKGLGLDLDESRFKGMVDKDLETLYKHGYKILVDDADCACGKNVKLGYNAIGMASIITVTEGPH